jgi:hypothetical protein
VMRRLRQVGEVHAHTVGLTRRRGAAWTGPATCVKVSEKQLQGTTWMCPRCRDKGVKLV